MFVGGSFDWILVLIFFYSSFLSRLPTESQIQPNLPFAQSVEMLKITRYAFQAIFVGGMGPYLNRLPHDFVYKIISGGHEP